MLRESTAERVGKAIYTFVLRIFISETVDKAAEAANKHLAPEENQTPVAWPARRLTVMSVDGQVLGCVEIDRGNHDHYPPIALLFLDVNELAEADAKSTLEALLAELASRAQPKPDEPEIKEKLPK